MTQNSAQKWYDNKTLLIILFFIFPPLGIYAIIKHKTETWKKVLYILPAGFYSLIFLIAIFTAIFADNYQSGLDHYNKKEYLKAYESFRQVYPSNKNYKDAIVKLNELRPIVDSIKKADELRASLKTNEKEADKTNSDEKQSLTTTNEVKNDIKSRLEKELASVNEGVKIAQGSDITALQMDLILLGAYWTIIKEGEESSDTETKKLANQLKTKVIAIQVKGFPLLRKRYVAFAKDLMWEHDVDVYSSGGGTIINLTAGMFAANRNIKQTQETISENMTLFRFKQVQYRWYKDADEFTYYDVKPPKDKEPVVFEK